MVQQRLTLSRQVFYFGLSLMLGASIVSATLRPGGGTAAMLVVLTGAALALTGRLWHRGLLRSARRTDHPAGFGGYRLDLPCNSRFTS